MSDYNKILNQFSKLNYHDNTEMEKHEIERALNQITYSNTGISDFDGAVADELWEHTPKLPSDKVVLKDYIHSIIEGQKILKDQMHSIEGTLCDIQTNSGMLKTKTESRS